MLSVRSIADPGHRVCDISILRKLYAGSHGKRFWRAKTLREAGRSSSARTGQGRTRKRSKRMVRHNKMAAPVGGGTEQPEGLPSSAGSVGGLWRPWLTRRRMRRWAAGVAGSLHGASGHAYSRKAGGGSPSNGLLPPLCPSSSRRTLRKPAADWTAGRARGRGSFLKNVSPGGGCRGGVIPAVPAAPGPVKRSVRGRSSMLLSDIPFRARCWDFVGFCLRVPCTPACREWVPSCCGDWAGARDGSVADVLSRGLTLCIFLQ